MEDILTVLTHHDAITGTSFQYVAQDYALRLAMAFDQSKETYKEDINELIKSQSNIKLKNKLVTCDTLTQNETVM